LLRSHLERRYTGIPFPAASSAFPPVQIGAHSGPQLRDLVDRVGAYRERAQVNISGVTGALPACIFALCGDLFDLYEDAPIAERRNPTATPSANPKRLHHTLS